jgi:hypothetical protein
MLTIIIQTDRPQELSAGTSLVERVVPREHRDEAYIRQLVQRITWALDDAELAAGADPVPASPGLATSSLSASTARCPPAERQCQ